MPLHGIWKILKDIAPENMAQEGRIYGGGLSKMEPRELAAVPAEWIAALLPGFSMDIAVQKTLFEINL